MDTLTILVVLILLAILGWAVLSFIMAERYRKSLSNTITTRGFNGVAGTQLTLQCGPNQVISLAEANTTMPRAVYICTDSTSESEDPSCDPFYQGSTGQSTNFFNMNNVVDVSADVSAACSGKNSCTWTVPAASDTTVSNICGGSSPCNGQIQLIGTYDCIPAS